MKKLNMAGMKFNRLTLLQEVPREKKTGGIRWVCLCECGNKTIAMGSAVKSGNIKSCGCLRTELVMASRTTHGGTRNRKKSPAYAAWVSCRERCYDTKNIANAYYGGRGIAVCDRWRNSFEMFLEDMGAPPSKGYTLDRIDCDGEYSPENCRWATRQDQTRNRRMTTQYLYRGEMYCLAALAEISGISYPTLRKRICQLGWDVEKAMNKAIEVHRNA